MPTYTHLKTITSVKKNTYMNNLQYGLGAFFDYAFLQADGFFNVPISTSGLYGGDQSRLRPVQDPNFTNGRVWEASRINWVWESGLESSVQPINISGITINSNYVPLGASGYVNYPLGRIVLTNPISTSSIVKCAYSHKYTQFLPGDHPWFRNLLVESYDITSPTFLTPGSGEWNILGQNRVQLPVVFIEIIPRSVTKGLELGGGIIRYQDVLFNIFTETYQERDKLLDIIVTQEFKRIYLVDLDRVSVDNRFPLTSRGTVASGALTYEQMVIDGSPYRWAKVWFSDTTIQEKRKLADNLYFGIIRTTITADLP